MKAVVLIDQLIGKGGAERVALELARAFNADIWTTNYIPGEVYPEYRTFRIYPHPSTSFRLSTRLTSLNFFWQGLIQAEAVHKFRRMDLSGYDVIISAGNSTKHVAVQSVNHPCIHYEHGVKESYRLEGLFKAWAWYMKKLDHEATMKVDRIVCNSENIKGKIARYYHLDAAVVYPPVGIVRFHQGAPGDYFLSVQRMTHGKGIETQLEAFRMLPERKLLIAGSAQESEIPYFRKLVRLAPRNVTFLGSLSDDEVSNLYSHATAVIQTNPNEDFGIVPVEAMASGKPCIAINAGGFKETIVPGKTGVLVDPPYSENLAKAIRNFNSLDFDPNACLERARLFSEDSFIERMRQIVSSVEIGE
jgi:glycosyltransferase involved in cell wall biosynthesis